MTTPYRPYERASFLAPAHDVKHLYAVMNDPCNESLCLLVNLTSIKAGYRHDDACVLDVGDHPFIRHPSYMLYRRAETRSAGIISARIERGTFICREDWRPSVFSRIARGLHQSEETIGRIVTYALRNRIGVEP